MFSSNRTTNSAGCISNKIEYWHIEVIDTTTNSIQNFGSINRNLQFFPNPAKNQFSISNPTNIPIKKIELTDFSGQVVQKWETQEIFENTLNIQHIFPGIYLLKAETEAGIKTEKLVIQ